MLEVSYQKNIQIIWIKIFLGYGRAEKQMHHTLGTLKKNVSRVLGKTLGRNCEIVLHDLPPPDSSIIAIANGHVTLGEILAHQQQTFA